MKILSLTFQQGDYQITTAPKAVCNFVKIVVFWTGFVN